MKNAKQLLPVLAVLLFVSLSCSFLKDRFANGVGSGSEIKKVPDLPAFDPNGPMVSPGAYVIRILAETDPSVAALTDQVEAAERNLMKRAIDENQPKVKAEKTKTASATYPSSGTNAIAGSMPRSAAAHLMFQEGGLSLPTFNDGVFFGGFTGFLKGMIAGAVDEGSFNKKDSKTEAIAGGTSTMHVEMGANPDGSTVFEMGIVTETQKNGVKARTELKSRIEGQDCPDVEGQLPITIKMRLSGQSGNSRFEQDVTAFVRVVVDDSAEIASTTVEVTQATARGRNGNNSFVETGGTYRREAGQERTFSNGHLVRKSDGATLDDIDDSISSGYSVAIGAADAAVAAAESTWRGGACIKIEATSPGSVEVASRTEIPVKVRHKKDGSEVAAKLDAKLVGEASVDPTLIPKAPGTLIYVAPGEGGKTATIEVKATSRRGIATLDLTANTGINAYRIAGGLDDWKTDTIVCDITKPFTLTGGGFTMNLSGGLAGTYEYSGPFGARGTGTYEITFPNGPGLGGDMVGRGDGSIDGNGRRFHGSGEENYSLYKVDGPCVDGPVKE